jgi:hypothetical protein
MSYVNVITGLVAQLKTVATLKSVLPYTPTSIHDWPMCYLFFNRAQYITSMTSTSRYFVTVRLVVGWQDWGVAEGQVMPYIDSIPAAVHADQTLGGRLTSGVAQIDEAEGGWVNIGGVEYRTVDFQVNVKRNL